MDCYDIFNLKCFVCNQIEIELGLFVQFVYCIVRVNVSSCSDANYMCCLSEYLVADRVLELVHCVWVVGPRPIHFYKLAWLKGISSVRVSVILFDERHDIKDIEDKSIGCTDRILKRGKRQSATIEGQPLKWGFFY